MTQDPESTVNGLIFGGEEPARHALPLDELMQALTEQLRSFEGCERVRVVGIARLDAPDEAGCNWSASLVLDPAGVAAPVYALAYAGMIGMARQTWNLK